ncbi:Protein AIM2 [Sparassis crispa]|uniref:Protein AIM2 n=1 Tax=Sparassis crispa TaxID=139825 RepID=A0A401GWL4_9APHY|nr:Protein AIM2 [Sparassis crispa]GBE86617.1 Protein AIM2 [Sparassis crispa]
MSMCADCFRGVRHEGEPEGKIEQIGGIECYVATPSVDYAKDKVILFLTDAFGIPLINNRLLADDFARNGFKTIIPDLFNGDPIDAAAFESPGFDFLPWVAKHPPIATSAIVEKVVKVLTESGVTRIGTTSYCFGAQAAFYLARANISRVTVLSHPSALDVPADLESYHAKSKAPLLINSCEVDPQFGPDRQAVADEIFGSGKFAPGYQRTYWEGCVHGFAVRGDLSDPKVKAGKEGSFKATVEFFAKYL